MTTQGHDPEVYWWKDGKWVKLGDVARAAEMRASWLANLPDGVPCDHPGCLSHITHPCEVCGRIGGKGALCCMSNPLPALKTAHPGKPSKYDKRE